MHFQKVRGVFKCQIMFINKNLSKHFYIKQDIKTCNILLYSVFWGLNIFVEDSCFVSVIQMWQSDLAATVIVEFLPPYLFPIWEEANVITIFALLPGCRDKLNNSIFFVLSCLDLTVSEE